jgi:TctA family transporter
MITLGMIGPWQWIIILIGVLIPIIVLIDVLRNNYTENNKLIWILVILFTGLIGTFLYLMFGTKQKIKKVN